MEHKLEIGFIEVNHTADWSVKVWAPDLPGLFSECLRAMLQMMKVEYLDSNSEEQAIDLQAMDSESLLVAFLNEVLYILETKKLMPVSQTLSIQSNVLHCDFRCVPLRGVKKEIKAVTFHNLEIKQMGERLEVVLVFDV
jgi:SHS2 domain-containing protein